MNNSYARIIRSVVDKIEYTQPDVINEVSKVCAEALKNNRMLYFFRHRSFPYDM